MVTLWMSENPRRRFNNCKRFQQNECVFFEWVDPPLTEHGIEVINIFLEKIVMFESEATFPNATAKVQNPTIIVQYTLFTMFPGKIKLFLVRLMVSIALYLISVLFK